MWATEDYWWNLSYDVVHFARSIVLGHHSIPKINWGSFLGQRKEKWRSFRSRYHFGADLGIISGLGIILGAVLPPWGFCMNSPAPPWGIYSFFKTKWQIPDKCQRGTGTLGIDWAITWIMSLRIAYIWQIEQVQIDPIKFERTEINFFSDVFTSAVVIVAQAP